MTLAILVNGSMPKDLTQALPANDRGFHYGDGLFETALLEHGSIRFLDAHLDRLYEGCTRLCIVAPERELLLAEISAVTAKLRSGVLKIILSRGVANTRGYRPATETRTTRIIALYAAPDDADAAPVRVRWCETRLGRNARLAGIKHLNRLEQVLAQAEWNDPSIEEGFMQDTEGELVCATSCNLFIVRDGLLLTPDLRFCGVRGVMRGQVMRAAEQVGISISEEPLWPSDLDTADEVFITNAVRGIRSVASLEAHRWQRFDLANNLKAALKL